MQRHATSSHQQDVFSHWKLAKLQNKRDNYVCLIFTCIIKTQATLFYNTYNDTTFGPGLLFNHAEMMWYLLLFLKRKRTHTYLVICVYFCLFVIAHKTLGPIACTLKTLFLHFHVYITFFFNYNYYSIKLDNLRSFEMCFSVPK